MAQDNGNLLSVSLHCYKDKQKMIKLHFTIGSQLLNVEEKIELENHCLATLIIKLRPDYQWMTKIVD